MDAVRAGVLVTGDEVLEGSTVDRNGPWLAQRLLDLGFEVAGIAICGDRLDDITSELEHFAARGCALVVTSGGLGPTDDDRTVEAVARFCQRPLSLDSDLEQKIAARLRAAAKRWRRFDEAALRRSNRKQALVPQGATTLDPVGTAPGLVVGGGEGGRSSPVVVVLPGPPRELKPLFERALETPPLRALLARTRPLRRRTLRFFGIPESQLAAAVREIADAIDGYQELRIGSYVHRGELDLVVRYPSSAEAAAAALEQALAERFPRQLFSRDGRTLDELVAEALAGRSVATAESCTGGLVGARLTARPGASAYFRGAIVAYDNAVKVRELGVSEASLATHGAVSQEVAEAMAQGAARALGAELAVSVTGIAGPEGGTPEKPVGTVWIGGWDGAGARAARLWLPGDRGEVRERATTAALHLLLALARGEEPPF